MPQGMAAVHGSGHRQHVQEKGKRVTNRDCFDAFFYKDEENKLKMSLFVGASTDKILIQMLSISPTFESRMDHQE